MISENALPGMFRGPRLWAVLGLALGLFVLLAPGRAEAWWNSDWTYRKQITIDAGAKGGALDADAGRMAVLVRLHDGNFKFSDAKEDGSDLRFVADDDKTPLKYHIEKFDSVFDMGLVWVDVPFVKAGASANIWMYWGNEKATPGGDPRGTFDSDYVLVYHFAEKDAPPKDTTAYANHAVSPAATDGSALIGSGARFSGKDAVTVPASASLALADGGALTVSMWIKPEASAQGAEALYARREGDRFLLVGLNGKVPFVQLSRGGGQVLTAQALAALEGDGWHHVAVSCSDQVVLYVDGKAVASLAATLPAFSGPVSVGSDEGGVPAPVPASAPAPASGKGAPVSVASSGLPAAPAGGYVGEMDELRFSKVARGAGLIRAEAVAQAAESRLLSFGIDEQLSSWSSGYVGVILHSVTLDGWVVIGILMVMMAVSWLVMVNRVRYTGAMARSNGMFREVFRSVGRDLGAMERAASGQGGDLDARELALLRRSPLFRLFAEGMEEMERRAASGRSTAKAAAAIRAVLDETLSEEISALNKYLVLLTIAISGGPFLGLLGTVVGVMITFAAIAASGDVNVNAIAPGIAAALVATVAGLAVAIPSLFGYNYLITKIKGMASELHIFVATMTALIEDSLESGTSISGKAAE